MTESHDEVCLSSVQARGLRLRGQGPGPDAAEAPAPAPCLAPVMRLAHQAPHTPERRHLPPHLRGVTPPGHNQRAGAECQAFEYGHQVQVPTEASAVCEERLSRYHVVAAAL